MDAEKMRRAKDDAAIKRQVESDKPPNSRANARSPAFYS